MHAETGDWLVIEQASLDHEPRRGLITEVHSKDGTPPYKVRWMDTGHIALVFPGPDAHIVSHAREAEANAKRQSRIDRVQNQVMTPRRQSDSYWTDW
jgi:hypothetical protein